MELMKFDFKGQIVRTVLISNEPHFALKDLCAAMGISNSKMVSSRVSPDGVSLADLIDSRGRTQRTTVVNESGLYEVIIRSDKPQAVKFRRWITAEVLPTIRKTGTYAIQANDHSQAAWGVQIGQPIQQLPPAPVAEMRIDPRKRRWEIVADHARANPGVWHPITIYGFTDKNNAEAASAIRYGHRAAFKDRTFESAIRDGQLYVRHNTPQPELTLEG